MSHWNYRVVVVEDAEFGVESYSIHEIYYDDDGVINGWSKSPIAAGGETKLELLDDLARMSAAAAGRPLIWDVNNDTMTELGDES